MLVVTRTLLLTASAAALQPSVPHSARRANQAAISCSASWDRRAIVGVLGTSLLGAVPALSSAYDAIPTVDADFAKLEQLRAEQKIRDAPIVKKLNAKVKVIEEATTAKEFISGADDLAVYVIGLGKFPEGVRVKELVQRIKISYDDLPITKYKCKETRSGICETHGPDVEDAMQQLMNQMRKYSMIQLGDYRKVEFKAF